MKSAELDQMFEGILTWCSEHGAKVIYGSLEEQTSLPTIVLNKDEINPLQAYTKTLTDLAPSVVVVFVQRLCEEDIEHELNLLSDFEPSAELSSKTKDVKECRRFVGNVVQFDIQALVERPAIILRIEDQAEWYDLLFGNERHRDFPDPDEEFEDPRTSDRIAALARRVAEDERFRLAKKRAQQELVAKNVLTKKEIAENMFHIVQQASAIFEMEIKPKLPPTK